MDLLTILPFIIFGIVAVGGYGFYKHAVKHTDGTDDIQTADSGQKGLMSSTHITDIVAAQADIVAAQADIIAAQADIAAAVADLDGFPDELKNLITHEIQQIGNIPDDLDILAAQWVALGALVEWTAWVPNLTGGADLSGYSAARYFRIGDFCFFHFTADNKNVTTAGVVQITLPFTTANTSISSIPAIAVYDGAGWVAGVFTEIMPNVNYVKVYKTAAGESWLGTENGVFIRISGFFEIA